MARIEPETCEALWATAALNAKVQDRSMKREQLHPLQIKTREGMHPVRCFDATGHLGVSALALHLQHGLFVTTGDDLCCVRLTGETVSCPVDGLDDVHELTLQNESLWIANTGRDEALEFDLNTWHLKTRLSLNGFRSREKNSAPEGTEAADRFHCNQIFQGLDGDRYVLVHHVSGYQLFRKIAERLIKSHGNGGVLNLDKGTAIPLTLKAPHSVRVIGGRYFVCDSGANAVRIYNRQWKAVGGFETRGFGRGAAFSPAEGLLHVGISATRARYLGVQRGPDECRIQSFSTEDFALIDEITVPHAEQITNLYLMPAGLTDRLDGRVPQ